MSAKRIIASGTIAGARVLIATQPSSEEEIKASEESASKANELHGTTTCSAASKAAQLALGRMKEGANDLFQVVEDVAEGISAKWKQMQDGDQAPKELSLTLGISLSTEINAWVITGAGIGAINVELTWGAVQE